METRNTEALRISDAILKEEARASREGFIHDPLPYAQEGQLLGYMAACRECARIARTLTTADF